MSNAVAVVPEDSLATRLSWANMRPLLGVTLQLGVLVVLTRALQVVSTEFGQLMLLAFAGFIVHALLPQSARLPFFLLLSIAGIGLVVGLAPLLWLLLLGGALIGVCYLPLRFPLRLAAVVAVLVVLILLRSGVIPSIVPSAVWPVLGSLFMFRLVIFLYDLAHRPTLPSPVQALSYFFLLPNVCIPLFPAIDFKAWERTYYDAETYRIHQRGLHWMARGLIQIVAYRLVYHHFTIETLDIQTAGHLLQYILVSFLLYLRISGLYHFAIGLLHLFGFHLPETNHLYWLSASFTDLFRRANIYWRDAMMKLVYYPTYFRLRGRSPRLVTIVSLGLVFVATWAMHSWMWFWLRGTPLLTLQDMSFYAMLGILITTQAVRDLGKPRTKEKVATWSFRRGLAVCATMGTQCLLWSYWTADSPQEWFSLWPAALVWNLTSVALLLGVLALGIGLGGARFGVMEQVQRAPGTADAEATRRSLMVTMACTALLVLVANPALPNLVSKSRREFLLTLRASQLNSHDQAAQLQGYYEQIDAPDALTSQMTRAWSEGNDRRWPDIKQSELWIPDSSLLQGRFKPSASMMWRDKPFTTNRFGLRGREVAYPKPPRTYRIALFGASDIMGSGVNDNEVIDALLERQLNQTNTHTHYDKFEVLNFGQSRAAFFQRAWLLDHRADSLQPDLVLFTMYPGRDVMFGVQKLERLQRAGVDLDYPQFREFVQRHEIESRKDSLGAVRALYQNRYEFLELEMKLVADAARKRGWPVIIVAMRQPTALATSDTMPQHLAEQQGIPFFEMTNYEGLDENTLRLAPNDDHPNVAGHAYLADRLYRELSRLGLLAELGVAAPAVPTTLPASQP